MKDRKAQRQQTSLPAGFAILSMLGVSCLSLVMGKMARGLLLQQARNSIESSLERIPILEESDIFLPAPLAKGDKTVPQTVYTTVNFDTRSSVLNSQFLKKEHRSVEQMPAPKNEKLTPINNETDYEYDADEEEHLPAGQHLLVDIDNVDYTFLNSEQELATAMLQMVDSSGLTLLSYHCHGLKPAGVTCVGVLLESHVSFHTWPQEGVITLDLFTCGSNSLLNHLQLVQGLFAVPRRNLENPETPTVLWAYKRRGFNEQTGRTGSRDTFAYPLGIHGYESKQEIAKVVTKQGKEGWVYDIQRSVRGTEDGGNPTRLFYLDGVLKASSSTGPAFYESFVHPSMIAHSQPKRVLVIGSTTGATVKEILKHKSVEQIDLVGVEETLLDFSLENLADWNDCSDIASTTNCLEDARVKAGFENPVEWLEKMRGSTETYDVIMMDMFDIEEEVAIDFKANCNRYLSQFRSLLEEDGIVAIHVSGDARSVDSQVAGEKAVGARKDERNQIMRGIKLAGFHTPVNYLENQSGFPDARSYLVAFNDEVTAKNWNRNEAQIKREIQRKSVATKSGAPTFEFFDGATMVSYSKIEQRADDCSNHPVPSWCDMKTKVDQPEDTRVNLTERNVPSVVIPNLGADETAQNLSMGPECSVAGGNKADCAWNVATPGDRILSQSVS